MAETKFYRNFKSIFGNYRRSTYFPTYLKVERVNTRIQRYSLNINVKNKYYYISFLPESVVERRLIASYVQMTKKRLQGIELCTYETAGLEDIGLWKLTSETCVHNVLVTKMIIQTFHFINNQNKQKLLFNCIQQNKYLFNV